MVNQLWLSTVQLVRLLYKFVAVCIVPSECAAQSDDANMQQMSDDLIDEIDLQNLPWHSHMIHFICVSVRLPH